MQILEPWLKSLYNKRSIFSSIDLNSKDTSSVTNVLRFLFPLWSTSANGSSVSLRRKSVSERSCMILSNFLRLWIIGILQMIWIPINTSGFFIWSCMSRLLFIKNNPNPALVIEAASPCDHFICIFNEFRSLNSWTSPSNLPKLQPCVSHSAHVWTKWQYEIRKCEFNR